jgi:hypothetical protein
MTTIAKRTYRDLDELKIPVRATITKFDPAGKQKSKDVVDYSVTITQAAKDSFEIHFHVPNKQQQRLMKKLGTLGDAGVLFPLVMWTHDPAQSYTLHAERKSEGLLLQYESKNPCEGLELGGITELHVTLMVPFCGTGSFLLDGKTDLPLTFDFTPSGTPATHTLALVHKITLQNFSIKGGYRTVTLTGNRTPSTIPAWTEVRMETTDETDVISSTYAIPK